MIKVNIYSSIANRVFLRQSPNLSGKWNNCQFYVNEPEKDCDWGVIYDSIKEPIKINCPKKHTILITGEPPDIKKYNKKYLNQFGFIVTCHKKLKHSNVINQQQALPWMLSVYHQKSKNIPYSYDEFKKSKTPTKTKLISLISSCKVQTKGQKQRLKFSQAVKDHFGSNIDVFGAGINTIDDKWEGVAPYKYHIAIENCAIDNYWTEKLSDSFLGEAYPIYHGCTNIFDYFAKNSLTKINIFEIKKSIKIIEKILLNDLYQKTKKVRYLAKQKILDEYNIFPLIVDIIKKHPSYSNTVTKTIMPENSFFFLNRVKY